MDGELLEKLFGYCYARTSDGYEAQELCSDITYALVKAANSPGELEKPYAFIWQIARNVYADFSDRRRRHSETFYEGDAEEIFPFIADDPIKDEQEEQLTAVYQRIAFLTKAYREIMILFYLDGYSTAQIAKLQNISETAVRQRLFSARKKIRDEVEEMKEMNETCQNKPVSLEKIDYVIWGTGNPAWSDPRNVCTRQFSKHIIWLCHKKPMSAGEIASELNVPTVYVEEELELLAAGEYGKYGLLKKLDNGKYTLNFILLDKEVIEKTWSFYTDQLPDICNIVSAFIGQNKEEYLAFPYLNKKADLNLILWQQISVISSAFSNEVERILKEKYFADVGKVDRPFSVFGYVDNGKYYGGGWDGVDAENVCGFAKIHLDNIYVTRIRPHFHCGLNISNDPEIQLSLRTINGLDVSVLTESEKEHAAKAIECGYLYREGEKLYTKILVSDLKDCDRLFAISKRLENGYFTPAAEKVAEKIADLTRKTIPEALLTEWQFVNILANMPVLDNLIEALIDKAILTPPENGVGAEGCWMSVKK